MDEPWSLVDCLQTPRTVVQLYDSRQAKATSLFLPCSFWQLPSILSSRPREKEGPPDAARYIDMRWVPALWDCLCDRVPCLRVSLILSLLPRKSLSSIVLLLGLVASVASRCLPTLTMSPLAQSTILPSLWGQTNNIARALWLTKSSYHPCTRAKALSRLP